MRLFSHEERIKRLLDKRAAYAKKKAEAAVIAEEKHKERLERKKRNQKEWKSRKLAYYRYLRRKRKRKEERKARFVREKRYQWSHSMYEQACYKRWSNGDRRGVFYIALTDDGTKRRDVARFKWMKNAMSFYSRYVKENSDDVWTWDDKGVRTEALLIEETERWEHIEPRFIRDEMGRLVSLVTEKPNTKIMDVAEVHTPTTYYVHGMDSGNRVTAKWIAENLMKAKKNDVMQVCTLSRVLVGRQGSKMTLILANNEEQCTALYMALEKRVKNPYILFTGRYNKYLQDRLIEEIHDITGWSVKRLKPKGSKKKT